MRGDRPFPQRAGTGTNGLRFGCMSFEPRKSAIPALGILTSPRRFTERRVLGKHHGTGAAKRARVSVTGPRATRSAPLALGLGHEVVRRTSTIRAIAKNRNDTPKR